MRLRRLVALLTSVTLLHLSVKQADAACGVSAPDATHHSMASAAGSDAHHMIGMDHPENSASASRVGTPPCEIPTPSHCCDVFAGCGGVAGLATECRLVTSAATPVARVRATLHDAPASFATAPEPPPPKA